MAGCCSLSETCKNWCDLIVVYCYFVPILSMFDAKDDEWICLFSMFNITNLGKKINLDISESTKQRTWEAGIGFVTNFKNFRIRKIIGGPSPVLYTKISNQCPFQFVSSQEFWRFSNCIVIVWPISINFTKTMAISSVAVTARLQFDFQISTSISISFASAGWTVSLKYSDYLFSSMESSHLVAEKTTYSLGKKVGS